MKICMVTGHRKLAENQIPAIRQKLEQEVKGAIHDGYTCFITGFAQGVDMLFAEVVLNERKHNSSLFLEAALPYPKTGNKRYRELLSQCNAVACISPNYFPGVYHKRNRSMVQSSGRVIAVYDGREQGGTLFTMRYAHAIGKEVKIIAIYS